MNADQFDDRMRSFEYYHATSVIPEHWIVIRLDGKGFSKFTERSGFEKPFDLTFHGRMVDTACYAMTELGAVYAYTESDEISLLFTPRYDRYDRSHEKLVSISAATAAGCFAASIGVPVVFDSRVWVGATIGHVVDYFRWRQSDAHRCALNGYAYWTLRKEGVSKGRATSTLDGKGPDFKNELLFERGINFNDVPAWQRRGTGIRWEGYVKQGFNPVTGEATEAVRRRLKVDVDLPMKDEYSEYIRNLATDALIEAAMS